MSQTGDDQPLKTERTLAAEIKIYYDLYVPPSAGAGARPLLIALHGYGSDKEWMMREARKFVPEGFAVASLQGFHQHMREPRQAGAPFRYGFGWLTNFHAEESIALHHETLLRLVNALVEEGVAERNRIFLLGFSQSCALNFRFAFTHPHVLRGIVGICGGIPGDWDTGALYRHTDAAVLYMHGERDEFYPPARIVDYAARLATRAREVEVKSYDGGHEFVTAMRPDIKDWLETRAAS